jgi:hypothetical protein
MFRHYYFDVCYVSYYVWPLVLLLLLLFFVMFVDPLVSISSLTVGAIGLPPTEKPHLGLSHWNSLQSPVTLFVLGSLSSATLDSGFNSPVPHLGQVTNSILANGARLHLANLTLISI